MIKMVFCAVVLFQTFTNNRIRSLNAVLKCQPFCAQQFLAISSSETRGILGRGDVGNFCRVPVKVFYHYKRSYKTSQFDYISELQNLIISLQCLVQSKFNGSRVICKYLGHL